LSIRKELQEIPDALRQMNEKGRQQYEGLIRRASWGEKPVFMLAGGSAYPAALTGAWAFQSLLGTPAVAARAGNFSAYTCHAVGARSLVIAVGGGDDMTQAVKKAKSRGAMVWAAGGNPDGPLAQIADAVVDCFQGDSADEGTRCNFCRHAAMVFLALAAAKVLKAPAVTLSSQEEELESLPRHVEWVLNQISDAAKAFAKEFRALTELQIIGGGAFYPIALQAARRLQQGGRIAARGCELLDFQGGFCGMPQPGSGVLYLSSSRCGVKTLVHDSVREIRHGKSLKIFALTDGNDRHLSERADAAVLFPVLTEVGGALIALAFLELVAFYILQPARIASARGHSTPKA
jgi:glucosamine 6-phosphate synthetase-like amidotransferase/phosphosugar isomerase protein